MFLPRGSSIAWKWPEVGKAPEIYFGGLSFCILKTIAVFWSSARCLKFLAVLGMARGSAGSRERGDRLREFSAGKAINPFISNKIKAVIENPIRFRPLTGRIAYGYPATLLADLAKLRKTLESFLSDNKTPCVNTR